MIFLYFVLSASCVFAQEPAAVSTSTLLPTYLALSSNLNDYTRFADGGADSNWYIGFNNAWIVKLPPAPPGDFSRAFIGARIGRAKTRPNPQRPWVRELIYGKVYMGISRSPSFSSEQSYFLAETPDIPVDPADGGSVDGIGSAEWFWAEVPVAQVNFIGPNYLIIWSPSKSFVQASSAPILAAAAAEDPSAEARAWVNRSISGVPPRSPHGALETPLNSIHPALAIKLVPANEDEVSVSELRVERGGKKTVVRFSVGGENIEQAWVESSRDMLDWSRCSRILRKPPYAFSLPADKAPGSGWFVRGAAQDALGNIGTSEPVGIPYAPR